MVNESFSVTEEDTSWLGLTNDYRLKFSSCKPVHSNFVVSATVVYVDLEGNEIRYQNGTNDEPCWIGGSICAERCALVSMRAKGLTKDTVKVKAVYITSDASTCISPGALCREFMYSSLIFDENTSIVLGSCDLSEVKKHPISYYYPHPFVFARLSRKQTFEAQKNFKFTSVEDSNVDEKAKKCYKLSLEKSKVKYIESNDQLSCVSCALFSDGSFSIAFEKRSLEYGTSLDAITQLAEAIETKTKTKDIFLEYICQVDPFGFAHAPYASGRAFLHEYGHGQCNVICHVLNSTQSDKVKWSVVKAEDLMPDSPKLKNIT